ncbi:hypothetical protein AB0F17_43800 [Nonomuraea sp. NPDC026600]|uniref:hypothetical protein n=1 Tax=Nonomuraea sp. NPDC026600 TaxID=3155363 RepID=UPI0033DF2D63
MAAGDDFERRLMLSVDAKGYGSKRGGVHGMIQESLLRVLAEAGERTGLNRTAWARQPLGDGELAILPATEPEPRVVEDFPRQLAAAIRRHNRSLREEHQLRLRLAIHFGTAIPAANGFAGAGPVHVSRLCESRRLKDLLVASGAALVVALSDTVYADVVVQGHTSLDPEDFRRVRVHEKELDVDAWVWVPGGDVHALTLSEPPDTAEGAPAGGPTPQKLNVNVFNEHVDARRAVFGFQE